MKENQKNIEKKQNGKNEKDKNENGVTPLPKLVAGLGFRFAPLLLLSLSKGSLFFFFFLVFSLFFWGRGGGGGRRGGEFSGRRGEEGGEEGGKGRGGNYLPSANPKSLAASSGLAGSGLGFMATGLSSGSGSILHFARSTEQHGHALSRTSAT